MRWLNLFGVSFGYKGILFFYLFVIYLMTSITVYATSDEWIMNWKGNRMKRPGPNLTDCPFICSSRLRNPQTNLSRTAVVSPRIETGTSEHKSAW
jgi:hypothetical protein